MMKGQQVMIGAALLISVFSLSSCEKSQVKAASSQAFFENLNQYEADATVLLLKDSQPNELTMKQKAQMNGTYEIEYFSPGHLKGAKIIYDGEKIMEYLPGTQQVVEEKPGAAEIEILVTSFARRLLEEGSAKKQEATLDGEKMITYELPIAGQYKYLSKEKLWMSKEDLTPIQLEIYDTEGNITIQVRYENFKYNL